jgi:hypothetical protein
MLTSRRLSYVIGAATLWVPLYVFAFIALGMVLVLTQPDLLGGGGPPPAFVALIVLHVFTMLLSFALLALYLVDVFRNPDLLSRLDLRIMWVVLVVALGGFAMLVYWWQYLRPGSESFHRRQTAGGATS